MVGEKFMLSKLLGVFKGNIIFTVIIIILGFALGLSAQYIFKKKDSHVEQMCESVIKETTGFDIDFSPDEEAEMNQQ